MNVHVRDGKIVKTSRRQQTDKNVTRVCNKGVTHALRVYGEDRIKYPMKRIGERGEGKWEQISWDEAIDTIVSKWKEVAEKHGPAANAFLAGSGNISPDSHHGKRLRAAMGATMLDAAQDRVFYAAMPPIVGNAKGQGGCGRWDYFNAKHLILWGYNPAESDSQNFHWILQAQTDHGTDVINIDPNYATSVSKADRWVPIRPSTDGALALGVANVLVEEGLVDEEFVRSKTCGPLLVKDSDGKYLRLSDLGRAQAGTPEDKPVAAGEDGTIDTLDNLAAPALQGTREVEGHAVKTAYELLLERVSEWTLEKTSELCDVPVDTIVELAHIMVDGPVSMNIGLGLDHVTNGMGTFNAIMALCMLAGQFCKLGNTGKGFFRGEIAAGWMPYALANPKGAPGGPTFYSPALLNCMDSGKYGDIDINIKTLYIWDHNLFGTQVGGVKWRKFFEEVELLVVADVVMTSTAEYADIVLPVCHYFECESASGDDTRYVFYSAKAAEPLYESKSDFEIFKTFFEKMGLQEYDFETLDDLYDAVFDNPVAKANNLTWQRVKEEGAVLTFKPDQRVFGNSTPLRDVLSSITRTSCSTPITAKRSISRKSACRIGSRPWKPGKTIRCSSNTRCCSPRSATSSRSTPRALAARARRRAVRIRQPRRLQGARHRRQRLRAYLQRPRHLHPARPVQRGRASGHGGHRPRLGPKPVRRGFLLRPSRPQRNSDGRQQLLLRHAHPDGESRYLERGPVPCAMEWPST